MGKSSITGDMMRACWGKPEDFGERWDLMGFNGIQWDGSLWKSNMTVENPRRYQRVFMHWVSLGHVFWSSITNTIGIR